MRYCTQTRGSALWHSMPAAPTDPTGRLAFVATGAFGMAVVDTRRFNNPIVLGQLDLPGDATDIAYDRVNDVVIVASNAGGLHFVDVSDPMTPTLLRTARFQASRVETTLGVAYASSGRFLRAFDVRVGQFLARTNNAGSRLYRLSDRRGVPLQHRLRNALEKL